MYLTTSHLDVIKFVGMVVHYQYSLEQIHLAVVKRIFKYLKVTMTYGYCYSRNQKLQLTAYWDDDWEKILDERKSTSGGAFLLGDFLV